MAPILHRLRWRLALGGALLLGLLVGQATMPVRAQSAQIRNNNNAMGLINFIDTLRYHNFGTTLGGDGFGIRENAGAMEVKDDGGAWAAVAGGGAPTDATYITQTANAGLSAEQALDALASGIMRVDTAAGVITSLTDSAGILANVGDAVGTGLLVFNTAPNFITSVVLDDAGFFGWTTDTKLYRDAANILAQRNDLDPQTWRLYESFAGVNFTGLSIDAGVTTAGIMGIVPITGGTGSPNLHLLLGSLGTGDVVIDTADKLVIRTGLAFTALTLNPALDSLVSTTLDWAMGSMARTSGTTVMSAWRGTFTPASGTPRNQFFRLDPTINWAVPAAGNYEAFTINAIETSIPTNTNYLARWQVGSGDVFTFTSRGSLGLLEQPAATADAGGIGQIWIRDDTPNMLFFTDDEGNDFLIGGESVFKSYTFAARAGSSGEFFQAGFYDYAVADANLSDGGATVTHGAANAPYGAHAFIVSGGNGTTDGSDLVLTVTGTSITDAGVRNAGGTEVIEATAEVSPEDTYFETTLKWIGTITYTLTSAGGGTFSYDFNYGFAKYDDFGDEDYIVTDFESVGEPNTDDAGFNIQLLHHNATGWDYDAAAFVAGNTPIADMNVDYSTEQDIDGGVPFAYKRTNLATLVIGSGAEGVLVRVTTSANGAITFQDTHIGVDLR